VCLNDYKLVNPNIVHAETGLYVYIYNIYVYFICIYYITVTVIQYVITLFRRLVNNLYRTHDLYTNVFILYFVITTNDIIIYIVR
jgi:hypothetical protein